MFWGVSKFLPHVPNGFSDRWDHIILEFDSVAALGVEVPVLVVPVDTEGHPICGEDGKDSEGPDGGEPSGFRNSLDNEARDRHVLAQVVDGGADRERDWTF